MRMAGISDVPGIIGLGDINSLIVDTLTNLQAYEDNDMTFKRYTADIMLLWVASAEGINNPGDTSKHNSEKLLISQYFASDIKEK